MKQSPVVHFEMPYDDADRVSKFYSEVFGWNMKLMEEMGRYILAGTTPTDENRMVQNPGQINGGFFPASDQNNRHPLVTIQVEDVKEAMEAVKASGGEVLGAPVEIPGVGTYVASHDTEGSRVSLLQPNN